MWKSDFSSSRLLTLAIAIAVLFQAGGSLRQRVPRSSILDLDLVEGGMPEITAPRNEYSFARLVYSGGEDGPNNWTTDSPKADITFVARSLGKSPGPAAAATLLLSFIRVQCMYQPPSTLRV
jgi:hypothetical protein